jgi:hypothetical protein
MTSPHARIRTLIAELVATWADEHGVNADISLSRIDNITFAFTDDKGERWDVRISRN